MRSSVFLSILSATATALAIVSVLIIATPAETSATGIQFLLPSDVEAPLSSGDMLRIIGGGTSATPVNCAPGTGHAQRAIIIGGRGNEAGQDHGPVDIIVFGDEPLPLGTEITDVSGPSPCNTDWKLYSGQIS